MNYTGKEKLHLAPPGISALGAASQQCPSASCRFELTAGQLVYVASVSITRPATTEHTCQELR